MRIIRIEMDRLRLPLDPPLRAAWDPEPRRHFDATIVRVHTDEGVTGIGSGDTMNGFEEHAHLFIGEDPLRMTRHVRVIETCTIHGGRFWPLEAALWDLVGKVTGQPVSVLFGNVATSIPAYASTCVLRPPPEVVEVADRIAAAGFRAMKIRIDPGGVEEGIARVAAVRESLGDDFAIMVDLNQAWRMSGDARDSTDLARTRAIARRLAELGVFWIEEPLPYPDLDGYRTLRRENPGVRIAAGEMHQSVTELLRYVEEDVLDVYQMDVVLAVGMARARTIAEVARLKHRQFTPHSWTNGIGVLANLHVAAGVGGGPYFELPFDPPDWTPERRDFMLARPVQVDPSGDLVVPDAPGLGIELDEEAVDRWRIG